MRVTDLDYALSLDGDEGALIVQAGAVKLATTADIAALGGGGGGTVSTTKFVIDPHAAQFGAKGDGRVIKDGVVTTFGGALTKVASSSLGAIFSPSDVGLSVWCQDYNVRTILSVATDGTYAIVNSAFSSWMAGHSDLVIQWGTDDTAAINAALVYARNISKLLPTEQTTSNAATALAATWAVGATVLGRSGAGYIVNNPLSAWNNGAGTISAIEVPRRVGFRGHGPGQMAIIQAIGSYGHAVSLSGRPNAAPYSDNVRIGGFSILCFGDVSDTGLDGLHLDWAFDGYPSVDCFSKIHDIHIDRPYRDGLYAAGRGENLIENIQVQSAGRYGGWVNGLVDSRLNNFRSGGSRKTGLRVQKMRSSQINGGKAFFSGALGGTVVAQATDATGQVGPVETLEGNCANIHLVADYDFGGATVITGFEAQESAGSSWVIEGGEYQLVGTKAVDPGRVSIGAAGTSWRPSVMTGYHLKGQNTHNVIFAGAYVGSELAVADTLNFGHANSLVCVEGLTSGKGPQKCKGTIHTMEAFTKGSDGTTWTPNLNGGTKVAGAGATNGQNTKLSVDGVALT